MGPQNSTSTSSVETVLSLFDPTQTEGTAPAPGIDAAALAASVSSSVPPSAPAPPSSSRRSLSRQTSASFRAAAGAANDPARTAAAPLATTTAATSAAVAAAGIRVAAATEAAAAARIRHNENELAIAQTILRLEQAQLSATRIARESHEEFTLLLSEARINAAEEARRLREAQARDHAMVIRLVTSLNGLTRDVASARVPPPSSPAASAPAPSSFAPPPSSFPHSAGGTMGPPASEASSSRLVRDDRPHSEEDSVPAKRQRTSAAHEEPYDVWFYDVSTSGEPRDIARAAMQAIPHLTAGSFMNAIRVRNRPATISIRFRTRPFALTFIDAIECCPPPNFDGLHACWAPAAADPIAIIRGEGFAGRSG
ncbi:hypothetical protein C8R43DRAFT_137772 [Mycena crocata]|nr:hypothetical protein C8R43DRAFT_137772 [Mycena crocata]